MSAVQRDFLGEADHLAMAHAGTVDRSSRLHAVHVGERSRVEVGSKSYRVLKRSMDVAISLMAIVFLFPLLALIAVALVIQDGNPIVFKHSRIGRSGRSFGCLKFRSMVRDSDVQLQKLLASDPAARKEWEETQKLRVDPRIHKLGAFLRKSSLDELPQLFNVLMGSMSIVGPRPIVRDEIRRYGSDFEAYASVRPGLTGLWQVSGRSDVGYTQRVAFDVEYVENPSLLRDIGIMFRTALIVVTGRGSC